MRATDGVCPDGHTNMPSSRTLRMWPRFAPTAAPAHVAYRRASKATGTEGGRGISDAHDKALDHWLRMTYPKAGELNMMSADGPHVNITECEQLEEAIDESCSFDLEVVKNFTNDIKKSDGWSIGFWVKSVGFRSLSKDGKFYPGLSLLHNISPPEPLFGVGKFNGGNFYPAAYVGTYGVDPNEKVAPPYGPYARECKAPPPHLFLCSRNIDSESFSPSPQFLRTLEWCQLHTNSTFLQTGSRR